MKYLACIMLMAFAWVSVANAQLPQPLELTVSPKYITAGSVIGITLSSFQLDLNAATINWYVDGAVVDTGQGFTQLEYQVGAVGETATIEVIVSTPGGSQFTVSRTIVPGDVDLVWEADTYTPPFYKGRSLFTSQSDLTVLAVPNIVQNGSRVPSNRLVYTWEQDGTVLGSKSGAGKNSLNITGSVLSQPETISVVVSTLDGSVNARKTITVPVTSSFVRMYEDNPLLGVQFNDAYSNTESVLEEEITLRAFPFFFVANAANELAWTWSVGGAETFDSVITLRNNTEETSGAVPLRVRVDDPERLLHESQTNLELIFE